jgi:LysR family nitrogen assimilation transcriptional regulator
MPISVFKEPAAAQGVVISEISGVQLNRLLVLATRIESLDSSPQLALKEIIEAEFARLALAGMFSFASASPSAGDASG